MRRLKDTEEAHLSREKHSPVQTVTHHTSQFWRQISEHVHTVGSVLTVAHPDGPVRTGGVPCDDVSNKLSIERPSCQDTSATTPAAGGVAVEPDRASPPALALCLRRTLKLVTV